MSTNDEIAEGDALAWVYGIISEQEAEIVVGVKEIKDELVAKVTDDAPVIVLPTTSCTGTAPRPSKAKRPCALGVLPAKRGKAVRDPSPPMHATVREEEQVVGAVHALFVFHSNLGPRATNWLDLTSVDSPDDVRYEALFKDLELLPITSLRQHVNAIGRWRSWCQENGKSWKEPTMLDVILFLREAKSRGKTAGRLAHAELRWAEANLGLQAFSSENAVRRLGRAAPGHTPKQRQALTLFALLVMAYFTNDANFYAKLIAATALGLWCCSIRFGHWQRSRIISVGDYAIEGLASRGKRRTGGIRTPFAWHGARFDIYGSDPFPIVIRAIEMLMTRCGVEAPWFLLPDFVPAGAPLDRVMGLRNSPMTGSRFVHYVRALAEGHPFNMNFADGSELTQHSWRHGLVTLSERSMMTPAERATCGLWVGHFDDNAGGALPRRLAMPLLYASEHGVNVSTVKIQLVRAYRRAVIRFISAGGLHGSKLVVSWAARKHLEGINVTPQLDKLVPYWPTAHEVVRETKDFIRAKMDQKPAIVEHFLKDGDILPVQEAHEEDEIPDANSGDSDTESSSFSAEDEASAGTFSFLHGVQATARLHLSIPYPDPALDAGLTRCGRHLASADTGTGLDEALATGRRWSPRCYRLLCQRDQNRWESAP